MMNLPKSIWLLNIVHEPEMSWTLKLREASWPSCNEIHWLLSPRKRFSLLLNLDLLDPWLANGSP